MAFLRSRLRKWLSPGSAPPGPTPITVEPAEPPGTPLPPIAACAELDRGVDLATAIDLALSYLSPCESARQVRTLSTAQIRAWIERDTWPIPRPGDREGYHGDRHLTYWLSGVGDYLLLSELLPDGVPDRGFLDLGCSSGRVLRHFAAAHPDTHVLGAEINRNSVAWARQHLPANAIVAQTSVLPQLPFADGSLDLISAFSVFTHIDEYEEGWLLELRRVLRPGGRALLTFHSERTWQLMAHPDHFLTHYLTEQRHHVPQLGGRPVTPELFGTPMPTDRVVVVDPRARVFNTNVFHHTDYVKAAWGRILQPERTLTNAHGTHQDAILLKR